MTSTVVAVLVVTLLLPGLALVFAVVLRFAFRGLPKPPRRDDADGPFDPGA